MYKRQTKDFSGGGFRRTTDANYAAFTRAWIELLLPLLKPDASVYVCCDWRSSPIVGLTLKDYFRLQNRITWQREKGRGAQRNWKNGRLHRISQHKSVETGRKKFGAMLGDHVEVGCNSVLNPGTVIGRNSNIYPLSRVRGVIPANHIFKDKDNVVLKK